MNIYLSFAILIISIAVHQSVSTTTTEKYGLKCVLVENKIKCENVGVEGQEVECDSVSNMAGSDTSQIFGIGTLPNGYNPLEQGTQLVSLFLYPRTLDTFVYLDHIVQLHGKSVNLTLYNDMTNTGIGIRVTDTVCYIKLLGLIDQVQKSGVQNVKVQASLIGDAHQEKLVGEIAFENQKVQKRQWGWGGWGRPWGGWGGWGRPWGGWGGWGRPWGWGKK